VIIRNQAGEPITVGRYTPWRARVLDAFCHDLSISTMQRRSYIVRGGRLIQLLPAGAIAALRAADEAAGEACAKLNDDRYRALAIAEIARIDAARRDGAS